MLQGVLEGKGVSGSGTVFADVRDVARAHVLAAETPEAKGRYIVSQAATTPPQLVARLFQVRQGEGSG